MTRNRKGIPRPLKELAIAEYISDYFSREACFPSNEEIVDKLKSEFAEEEVGPLYPKDITNLKKGAYKLLEIEVALPRAGNIEVELREALDLDGAIVVGSPYRNYDMDILRNIIGYQAARFFDENVRDGQSVTFSCSLTMREMIKRVSGNYTNLKVMADSVVAVDEFHVMSPASLVVLFLDRFPECRGISYICPPSLVEMMGREKLQQMLDSAVFSQSFQADWVFVGVGALTQELSGHGLTPGFDFLTHVVTHSADDLRNRGVVGEISYWPFDSNGEPVYRGVGETLPYFRHVFTYSKFDELSRKHRLNSQARTRVVGAAGGLHKVEAIKAAARYLDYLVTDVKTAQAILES